MSRSFAEIVIVEFGFLIDSFGYMINQKMDDRIVFCSTEHHCCIEVCLERKTVEFKIGKNEDFTEMYSLKEIFYFLNPDINFDYAIGIDDIQKEAHRIATYLLEYCQPIINGSLNIWQDLHRQRQVLWDELEQDPPKLYGIPIVDPGKKLQ